MTTEIILHANSLYGFKDLIGFGNQLAKYGGLSILVQYDLTTCTTCKDSSLR